MGAKTLVGSVLSGTKGKETRFQPCLSGNSAVVVPCAAAAPGQASQTPMISISSPSLRRILMVVRIIVHLLANVPTQPILTAPAAK